MKIIPSETPEALARADALESGPIPRCVFGPDEPVFDDLPGDEPCQA